MIKRKKRIFQSPFKLVPKHWNLVLAQKDCYLFRSVLKASKLVLAQKIEVLIGWSYNQQVGAYMWDWCSSQIGFFVSWFTFGDWCLLFM